jgi:hypothetical protein
MIESIQNFIFKYQDFFIVIPILISIVVVFSIPDDEWRDI